MGVTTEDRERTLAALEARAMDPALLPEWALKMIDADLAKKARGEVSGNPHS